jgi:hypothetical protein
LKEEMKRPFLKIALAVAALTSLNATAQVITYQYTGTVTQGYDTKVVDGQRVTTSLLGQLVSGSLAIDTSRLGPDDPSSVGYVIAPPDTAPPSIQSITVNGTLWPSPLGTYNNAAGISRHNNTYTAMGVSRSFIDGQYVFVDNWLIAEGAPTVTNATINDIVLDWEDPGITRRWGFWQYDYNPDDSHLFVAFSIDSIQVTYPEFTTPVPEPSTYALFGAGLLILGLQMRKRNSRVQAV